MHAEFFDAIYRQAAGDDAAVPWQHAISRQLVGEWLSTFDPSPHQRAIVVAAGLGDDAAALARTGLDVVAFDQSETAVAWSRQRHRDVVVDWCVADLFDPPERWRNAFDLVVEVFTIQSMPPEHQEAAAEAIRGLLAPGGRLLAIALVREFSAESSGPPWPLDPATFDRLLAGLDPIARHDLAEESDVRCVRVELRRPAAHG
jgi:SAM-dependent methyltransferase